MQSSFKTPSTQAVYHKQAYIYSPFRLEASANDSKHRFLAKSEGRMALTRRVLLVSRVKLGGVDANATAMLDGC